MRPVFPAVVAPLFAACLLDHGPARHSPCGEATLRCAQRDAVCGPLRLIDAICEGTSWRCPSGSSEWVAPWQDDRCLPLRGSSSPSFDGVHEAAVPVPLDGRCTWVVPSGPNERLVSVPVSTSCASLGAPEPLALRPDASFDYLSLQAAFADASGQTRLLSRGWKWDAKAAFGVRSSGVGLATLRARQVIMDRGWLFDDTLDLGDAALIDGDFLYAYGCPGAPHWLEEDCIVGRAPLARIDERSSWQLFDGKTWGDRPAKRVFGSGPHRGPVVHDPRGGFLHVYAIGFGSTIEATHAERPEGPWSAPRTLHECELPPEDPAAYCAGPIVHLELYDPTRPNQLVIGYSIGTTAEDGAERQQAARDSYWPRIVRVAR